MPVDETSSDTHGVPVYRRLSVSARPVRCATVFRAGPDWTATVMRMLENYSRMWGGMGNILIPCDAQGNIHEAFWRILERYDPDRLGVYQITNRHHLLADPERFKAWVNQQANDAAARNETSVAEERTFLTEDTSLDHAPDHWRPAPHVEKQILRRLAPAHRREAILWEWCSAENFPGSGGDLVELPRTSGLPLHVLEASQLDPSLSLILAAHFGTASPQYEQALQDRGTTINRFEIGVDHVEELLNLCWFGRIDPLQQAGRHAIERLQEAEQATVLPWREEHYLEQTPFAQTIAGCSWFSPITWGWSPWPCVVVVGDSVEDFCLALALHRLCGTAAWLPNAYLEGTDPVSEPARRALADTLSSVMGSPDDPEQYLVTSFKLEEKQLLDASGRIFASHSSRRRGLAKKISPCEPIKLPLPDPRMIYDKQQSTLVRHEAFVADTLAGEIETPIPTVVADAGVPFTHWYVDVQVHRYQLPARAVLTDLVSPGPTTRGYLIRPSHRAITYFSQIQGFTYASARLDQQLARPQIRLPGATEVFQRLLSQGGLTAQHSDKGRYTAATIDLWGELSDLAKDLRDDGRYALFQAYCSKKRSECDPGVFLEGIKRRFLSFENVRQVTGLDASDARRLIDSYLARGILARGLVLQCPRCRFAGWYVMEEVGQRFRCDRCRKESLLSLPAWKEPPEEPNYYYELTEMVFQAMDNNMHAPVLALDRLQRKSYAFHFTPELVVRRDDLVLAELDVWALVDGRVIIGEATTTNQLCQAAREEADRAARIAQIAEAVTADEVVFATTEENWRPATKETIQKAFAGARPTLRFLDSIRSSGTP